MILLSRFFSCISFILGVLSIGFAVAWVLSPTLISSTFSQDMLDILLPSIPYLGAVICLFLASTSRAPWTILWIAIAIGLFLAGIGSTRDYVFVLQPNAILLTVQILSGAFMFLASWRLGRIWEYLEDNDEVEEE